MKTIKTLAFALLLSLTTLSCSTDDTITETQEEPIEVTQRQFYLYFSTGCNIRRTLIVNGVEQDLGASYNSSYVQRTFNQGDVIQIKIQNNGTCNQSNWRNEVIIYKVNEQGQQHAVAIQSCNNCNVLFSSQYIVE